MISKIKQALGKKFQGKELAQIVAFLDQGFSENGQIAVASIFLFAKEYQVSVADVLAQCQREWDRNWKNQHPEIRGNPDAPGGAGTQNRASLENIYVALGIPSPFKSAQERRAAGEKNIPSQAIVVITGNSVYRFGEADKTGKRTVSRDNDPLDFSSCRILILIVGESMKLECLGGSHSNWYTTLVTKIE